MKVRRGRPPRIELAPDEAAVLAGLADQVDELLGAGPAEATGDPLEDLLGPVDPQTEEFDPALRRLLPDAYRDDESAAEEWRRYGRGEVRQAKSETLRRLIADCAAGGSLPLDDERLAVWLPALTDIRLVLSARLGIRDDRWIDEALRLPHDDPRRGGYALYEWLTALQSLILDKAGAS